MGMPNGLNTQDTRLAEATTGVRGSEKINRKFQAALSRYQSHSELKIEAALPRARLPFPCVSRPFRHREVDRISYNTMILNPT